MSRVAFRVEKRSRGDALSRVAKEQRTMASLCNVNTLRQIIAAREGRGEHNHTITQSQSRGEPATQASQAERERER